MVMEAVMSRSLLPNIQQSLSKVLSGTNVPVGKVSPRGPATEELERGDASYPRHNVAEDDEAGSKVRSYAWRRSHELVFDVAIT